MADIHDKNEHASEDERRNRTSDFLNSAREASESGDFLLSMYLYLAAFQKSLQHGAPPTEDAIYGLKQAWALACTNKERSMAEYIFELMEPYLSADEITLCADQLQNLVLDKLQEFGISRDDLEDMAQMISDDVMCDIGPMVKVSEIFTSSPADEEDEASSLPGMDASDDESPDAPAAGIAMDASRDSGGEPDVEDAAKSEVEAGNLQLKAIAGEVQDAFSDDGEVLTYDNLAGYDAAVSMMRDFGIGMGDDPKFQQLVGMLNSRHGLSKRPAPDSMLIRANVREDASRFMTATLGELGLPSIHMRMEENFQGMPVLCISAHNVDLPSANSLKDALKDGGVLVLEDLDFWEAPSLDLSDDTSSNAFFIMQMTRGAREAVGLVRSAVENPNVHVIATASLDGSIDEFFLEMLEPLSLIDIDYPTEEERDSIWMDIAKNHPSLRSINRRELVKYSANLARFDIYMASREAVEEAYKLGLMTRRYQPVTRDNIFDKLAAYQPLESSEYSELENEVIRDFQSDLDHIDDILEGE